MARKGYRITAMSYKWTFFVNACYPWKNTLLVVANCIGIVIIHCLSMGLNMGLGPVFMWMRKKGSWYVWQASYLLSQDWAVVLVLSERDSVSLWWPLTTFPGQVSSSSICPAHTCQTLSAVCDSVEITAGWNNQCKSQYSVKNSS